LLRISLSIFRPQSVIETFRGGVYTITRDELEHHLLRIIVGDLPVEGSAFTWCKESEPDKIIDILWRVGFLRAQAVGVSARGAGVAVPI